MSEDLKQAGYLMRIAVVALVFPIVLLATMFFLWEGLYIYAGAMLVFGSVMAYGVYMNWKRLASDEKIDDERMQKINWKSGSNAFWTVINTSIILYFFDGAVKALLKISESTFNKYSLTAVTAAGFISYFAFRTYYLKTGVENEFWRVN